MAVHDPAMPGIALNRFGLGARPDDTAPADGRQWLRGQLGRYEPRPPAWDPLPTSGDLVRDVVARQREIRGTPPDQQAPVRDALRKAQRQHYLDAIDMRALSALDAPTPFVERLVHFWANHFAISVENPAVAMLAGSFEAEAIRPHVLGRFEDMVLAVERHPAMLLFLNQNASIGPGSVAATRAARRNPAQQRGLNENLAREIMELHTLGVRSGYGQEDVTEFARALTGWSVAGLGAPDTPRPGIELDEGTGYVFQADRHEPGPRKVLGRSYGEAGQEQAAAIMRDFARADATAHHVATKLARHFVADDPPPAVVDRLARAYRDHDGELKPVYQALIASPQAWRPAPAKFKTPWEWLVSALRGLGRTDLQGVRVAALMQQLGQPLWRPGSPAGYDDVAGSWAAPDALMRRVELAGRLASLPDAGMDARQLAPRLLPGLLGEATATALSRAESGRTAMALLLVSPEFLRR
ncbi:DUF1800 domain-containing protein [Pigmentiphaga kullae]|uniref:Uncharacterized protein (DUF1800 family) n=1 Tax=Pigmentiphaga kullae TaxID=151784 RepID=A0A4Q7NGZ9_9BURK|nr:DUF1800 domain-containing protein [Pigmentiphaga kullae]RZS84215.1 uncharacterized protein (DUF1800 family) [Pigmentiphaga kullae]